MGNGIFNSEQVSLKVKDFFEKVRGMRAYFFNVDECVYDELNGIWNVSCHFIPNPFEGREEKYRVKVDGKTGDVIEVTKIIGKV